MDKLPNKAFNYKEYPQRIALRFDAFAIAFWTTVYGALLLNDMRTIEQKNSYGFIKLIGEHLGESLFPSVLMLVGILKMLSIICEWKSKKLFLHALSFTWGLLEINFIIQNNNGGSNYGWLFCLIVLSILFAAYGEEQAIDG